MYPNSPKDPSLGRYGISKFWSFLQTIKYKENMGVKMACSCYFLLWNGQGLAHYVE
jgi:hypothetical protein